MAAATITSQHPSGNDLSASIGKNTILGMVSNVAQVGTRLITIPIVIHSLGLAGYGIWSIIMMTATYMRFGSVGIKSAFQKYVAEATGSGDYGMASRLLSTGCVAMFVLSIGGLIPVAVFSARIAGAAGVPAEFLSSASGSISLLAMIMLMSNVGAAYEAIITGGHRIDLIRKFSTILTILEAAAIVGALHFGAGLFAMSAVMGTSELVYVICCFVASRRVLPQVRVSPALATTRVLYELFRFGASYQLVNILEIVYASIVPLALLRAFGANTVGIYTVVTRLVAPAALMQDSFLSPILSGATMVYASGSIERMQRLLVKSFKVTLGLSLFPLGFMAVFGTTIAYVWTSQSDPLFRVIFWLVCLTAFFRSLSLLSLVLYRASGNALLDNIRQLLRIVIVFGVAVSAGKIGIEGVLIGLALSELGGLVFMLVALARTFRLFSAKALVPDAFRLTIAAVMILGVGCLVYQLPLPWAHSDRLAASLRLSLVGLTCLCAAWPSLRLTRSLTAAEGRAIIASLLPRRSKAISDATGA